MSKLLGAQSIEGNPLQKIEELRQRVAEAEDGAVNAATLSDITPYAGQLQEVDIIAREDFDQDLTFISEDNGTNLGGIDAGWVDASISGVNLIGRAKTSTERGISALQAYNDDATVSTTITVQSDGRATYNYRSVIHALHHGEAETYTKVATTTESSVAYTSVPANAMGINGRINMRVYVLIKNNKGSNGTYDLKVYFGSKVITFVSAQTIVNSATVRHIEIIDVEVVNDGATNAQNIMIKRSFVNIAAATAGGLTYQGFWDTAAIDTTAAVDFKLNIDLSVTDANFFSESSGEYSGAYGTYS